MTTAQTGAPGEETIVYLLSRRSVQSQSLGLPGPSDQQLSQMLKLASRVPDHGNLEPWRFIVLTGESRNRTSGDLAEIYGQEKQAMDPTRLIKFKGVIARLFTCAPVVVLVVASPRQSQTVPISEQLFSAGAVCMNLMTAVHLLGFHCNWLSGWVTSSVGANAYFDLRPEESFVGVIQIGTALSVPEDRKRPDLGRIVSYWP